MNEQEAEFRAKLDDLVDATMMLSGRYLSHGSARKVLEYDGMKAVPWLLNYLKECRTNSSSFHVNPWVALEVIHHYVPDEYLPDIPQAERGKLSVVLDYYIGWGVYRGMVDAEEG